MNGDLSGSCMTSMEPDLQFGHAAYPKSGLRQGTYKINIAYLWGMYSEQKNRFAKGQNLLVSQITAQGTKVKACEFYRTKIDTLSFVIPKYRTLVPAIGLIYILQLGTLDESVFLPMPFWPLSLALPFWACS